ncbi:MAG TPA: hypothetical protein VMQ93_01360, partial [Novosphingobium sp.]|nr:hypothetical protein [Novosphingobium sp.]
MDDVKGYIELIIAATYSAHTIIAFRETGNRFRHFADEGVTSSDLGVQAARHALEAAGCQAADIDLIICATSTPDMVFPSTACL